ncbi:hypothetical protein RUM43_004948 [Polyplax serrata]|uniref:LRRCT domain-containing protein n=1 Tax=Polyplax serrata TaxID=468196 RepID=A0AAN8SBF9_POLSC
MFKTLEERPPNMLKNQIAAFSNGDWAQLRYTLTNIFLGENDITELPQIKNGNGNGINYNVPTLADFKSLTWINLDDNKLTSIPDGTLPVTLQTLSASNNMLTQFPMDAIEKMTSLSWVYLNGNYIENIPHTAFEKKTRLDKLDLRDNGIRELSRTMFNGSITIKDLLLDLNFIRTLPPQAFRGLNLRSLHLTNNRLKEINPKALLGLGPYLELLDLENNYLNGIPKALKQLKRLKLFYIPNNNITEINDDDFESFASVLKALSLARNNLEEVPSNALRDCVKLSHLNIGYNRISRINESDFDNWGEKLHTLILRSNRLTELPANVFRKTPQLRELSLSFNKLHYIHKDAFADIENLESLEISFGMHTEEFPRELLKPLRNLVWLSLDNNQIRTITSNSFVPFSRLQYLNLESNRLEKIHSDLFPGSVLHDLRDVRLSYNNIAELDENSFSNLRSLQTLLLNGNKLKKLNGRSFADLSNLMALSLTNNQIRTIAPRAFVNLPNLMRLELQNNELKVLSLHSFLNVTNPDAPMLWNLSYNQIVNLTGGFTGNEMHVKVLDLSHNNIQEIPINCLQNFAKSLKTLNLGYNGVSKLVRNAFGELKFLEVLNLERNNILKIDRRAFDGLDLLQIINLSENHIDQLQTDQFKNLDNLRYLDLTNNHIRSVSREIFQKTRLEFLVLSSNHFVVVPNSALGEIGYTLRYLDMSDNQIEHLDSTMFREIPFLTHLNLSTNRLTILPDNVFIWVGNLLVLDLSHNRLRSNFKELFHNVQKLKRLRLANTGLINVPTLPLPNLTELDLSSNNIETVYVNSVEYLVKLRTLVLSDNKLNHVPSKIWNFMPLLKKLDLSRNPIKIITKDSFYGLHSLQQLDVSSLRSLERFDSDSFAKMKMLSKIKIQTWPQIEKYRFRLGNLLANVPSLKHLIVEIMETHLTDQLLGSFNPKLKNLEISGTNLRSIDVDAFDGIEEVRETSTWDADKYNCVVLGYKPPDPFLPTGITFVRELTLRIRNTSLRTLKPGVLYKLQNIPHFTLDLSRNKFKSLSPHSLCPDDINYQNIRTKLIAGGLTLNDNPWVCDCGLTWLGYWLRRWLRETVQIHTVVLEVAQQMNDLIRSATCTDSSGQQIAIVDLYPEDLSCHASALSRGGSEKVRSSFVVTVIFTAIIRFIL